MAAGGGMALSTEDPAELFHIQEKLGEGCVD